MVLAIEQTHLNRPGNPGNRQDDIVLGTRDSLASSETREFEGTSFLSAGLPAEAELNVVDGTAAIKVEL